MGCVRREKECSVTNFEPFSSRHSRHFLCFLSFSSHFSFRFFFFHFNNDLFSSYLGNIQRKNDTRESRLRRLYTKGRQKQGSGPLKSTREQNKSIASIDSPYHRKSSFLLGVMARGFKSFNTDRQKKLLLDFKTLGWPVAFNWGLAR